MVVSLQLPLPLQSIVQTWSTEQLAHTGGQLGDPGGTGSGGQLVPVPVDVDPVAPVDVATLVEVLELVTVVVDVAPVALELAPPKPSVELGSSLQPAAVTAPVSAASVSVAAATPSRRRVRVRSEAETCMFLPRFRTYH